MKRLVKALSSLKSVLAKSSTSKESFDQIPGGLSEGKTPDDFSKEQLENVNLQVTTLTLDKEGLN